jgi:hypothetical protein
MMNSTNMNSTYKASIRNQEWTMDRLMDGVGSLLKQVRDPKFSLGTST